jgi:hypothetical protein
MCIQVCVFQGIFECVYSSMCIRQGVHSTGGAFDRVCIRKGVYSKGGVFEHVYF